MLKLIKKPSGFRIIYKNHVFLEFSKDSPIIFLGKATEKIRMFYGEYRIRDKVKEKIALTDFEIISESPNNLVLRFYHSDVNLTIDIRMENEKLLIIPSLDNTYFNRFWIYISAEEDEAIYGCGAQYAHLDLRGKRVRNWVQEEMLGEKSYFHQPTFISSRKYFCHAETFAYSECNFMKRNYHELYFWDVPKKIIIGKYDTLLSVVSHLTFLLGTQPPFPDWVYDGIILGIQGGNSVVKSKVKKAEEYDLNVVGVWCQDWVGYLLTEFGKLVFYNWEYDDDVYPNLSEFILSLEKEGISFLGYINPFLNVEGDLYKEASQKGYCVKDEDGNDYYINMGAFAPALIDLTNPKAVQWIKSIVKENMINIGLNGWMTDYGEYLPTDSILYSGEDPKLYHNKYIVEWARIIYECLEETGKSEKILTFNRAGFSHFAKYVMLYWPGDQIVNWDPIEGLPTVITSGISCGLTGVGNYHFDIGGFSAHGDIKRTKELFMRWAEIACFSMVMRSHEGNKPYVNWQFDSDKETLEHLTKMVKIHVKLKPYLKRLEEVYQKKGIPPIRACFLHYEDDLELRDLKYQYLLGRDLLVAPVIKPEVRRWRVYLPEDSWIHLWTSKEYQGGWIEIMAPIGKPPVFYRKNSQFSKKFKELIIEHKN